MCRFSRCARVLALVSILFSVHLIAGSVNAATFVVNDVNDVQDLLAGDGLCATAAGACTLRAAITEANALAGADIITLPAGTYTITIAEASDNTNANGDFDLTSEITINGAGSGTTIVQANAARGVAIGRVFHLRAAFPMQLNGMTVRYGRYTTAAGTFGAGIRVDVGAVIASLNDVVVTENDDGTSGGGIAVSGAAGSVTTLTNCVVSNNTAGGTAAASSLGAGIMGNAATARIDIINSTITGNTASNTSTSVSPSGGGISSIGTLNITNSTVSNNTATSSGFNSFTGGVHITGGTATITGSTISNNLATVTAGTGAALIGGIYNQQATLNISNSTVSGNAVTNAVTATNAFHAGIRVLSSTVAATTNITNSTISGNAANGEGGGIVNISGGAANATMNIIGSTITGNTVQSTTGAGGGLEQFTTSTGLGVMNVTNSTISGNSAANGAGSFNTGATATINFNFATIASNTAPTSGGGLRQETTGVTNLKNSVVADNTSPAGPDISGTITSQDYNHVENTTGGTFFVENGTGKGRKKTVADGFFALPNDVTGSDPGLGVLQNNGGPTLTHAPGAPIMNLIPNGTNDCGTVVTTDQRAGFRPAAIGLACEKGAMELGPTAAGASISGRVFTANGNGIRNAIVTIDGGNLTSPQYVRTGAFGYFTFEDLQVGETYILTINSKRYVFANPTRVVSLTDDIVDFDFVAE